MANQAPSNAVFTKVAAISYVRDFIGHKAGSLKAAKEAVEAYHPTNVVASRTGQDYLTNDSTFDYEPGWMGWQLEEIIDSLKTPEQRLRDRMRELYMKHDDCSCSGIGAAMNIVDDYIKEFTAKDS